MTAAGLAAVEAAQKDGRWNNAYDAPSTIAVPEDFIEELKGDKGAYSLPRHSTGRTRMQSPGGYRPPKSRRRAIGASSSCLR